MEFINYLMSAKEQIIALLIEHIELTALAVFMAIIIGVPLGILISYVEKLNKPILGIANIIQAIPSMALLGFAIPFLGIGRVPAILMVVLYSLLPIIKNTYTGIQSINGQTLEAARGIGMTKFQILTKVQIPLALPVIMAGVRISAVTAVGLMTMAAFIGAGGLGYLVFSGIRTVNNNQILAGAIPACLLALCIDFLISIVEKLVTPTNLQLTNGVNKTQIIKKRAYQKRILITMALLLVVNFTLTHVRNISKNTKEITLGTKDYTEQEILGNMLAEIIEEKTDIKVNRKFALGGTQVCFTALKSHEIDMYVEYSGTAYGDVLKHEPVSDPQLVYDIVKKEYKEKFNIEVLKQMGFNNTYTLSVRPETAQKYGLKTISDLAKVSNDLILAPSLEFINREDGFVGLDKIYAFSFKDIIGIDGSPRYTALINGESDVIDAFATDGLLKTFNLTVLEDDKQFFLPYYAMPILTTEVAQKYPEIMPIIEELGNYLNDDTMRDLNYQVDEKKREPKDVAIEFLENNNLI